MRVPCALFAVVAFACSHAAAVTEIGDCPEHGEPCSTVNEDSFACQLADPTLSKISGFCYLSACAGNVSNGTCFGADLFLYR